jgi:hypothetical protein
VLEYLSWAFWVWCVFANPTLPEKPYFFSLSLAKVLNMQKVLSKAIVAIECENSLWRGNLMPDYRAELKPQKRLGGKLGLKKNAVLQYLRQF